MILCVSQNNVVTTVYDIFHLYISYHSSSSIYVDLIAPVANVICYYTTSTINKYFLSYFLSYLFSHTPQVYIKRLDNVLYMAIAQKHKMLIHSLVPRKLMKMYHFWEKALV